MLPIAHPHKQVKCVTSRINPAPMTTKKIRAVTYLPPQYHKQLRQYMKQQNLSESAAIVEIVKQFFEQPAEPELKVIPSGDCHRETGRYSGRSRPHRSRGPRTE